MLNKGDTLTTSNGYPLFCDGSNWRDAKVFNFYGTCDKEETTDILAFGRKSVVCMDSSWKTLDAQDSAFGLCTTKRNGEMKTAELTYVCKYHKWVEAEESDRLGTCNEDNIMEKKTAGTKDYVCRNQLWEQVSVLEERYGLCTKDRFGEIIDSTTNVICKNYNWELATEDEVLGECTSASELSTKRWKTVLYVCRNSEWDEATTLEDKYGICTIAKDGDITKDRLYVCDNNKWVETNAEQYYGACTEELQYTIFDEEYEMCDNGVWRKRKGNETYTNKFCIPDRELTTYSYNSLFGPEYYICTQNKWKQVSLVEYTVGLCTSDSVGKSGIVKDSTYFCDGTRYYNTNMKSLFGECTEEKEGVKKTHKEVDYICTAGEWKKSEELVIKDDE